MQSPSKLERSEFSGPKREMLRMVKRTALHHLESNLKIRRQRPCGLNEGLLPVCQPQTKKRGCSIESINIEIPTEASLKNKTNLLPNLNIEYLLSLLKGQFDHVRSLKLSETNTDRVPGTLTDLDCIKTAANLDLETLTKTELLNICTQSKEVSLGFQGYLAECSEEDAHLVASRVVPLIPSLIEHQFGNYVIQRLALRISDFDNSVAEYCLLKFETLIHNEFASRVLQCLIESRSSFRQEAMNYFTRSLDSGISSIPATHLVVACIKNTKVHSDLEFIPNWLQRNPSLTWNKCFQKILTAYIEPCTQPELDEIFRLSNLEKKPFNFLNCKMTTYFLTNMLLKNHQKSIDLLILLLSRQPTALFDTKCYKLLLIKLWEEGKSEVVSKLALALTNLGKLQLKNLWRKSPVFYFYVYTTLATIQIAEMPLLINNFLSRKDLTRPLSGLIRQTPPTSISQLF